MVIKKWLKLCLSQNNIQKERADSEYITIYPESFRRQKSPGIHKKVT
jgi:hypothetical protein